MRREAFETTLRRKLKKFADINNDKEIDWNEHDVPKWYIYGFEGNGKRSKR